MQSESTETSHNNFSEEIPITTHAVHQHGFDDHHDYDSEILQPGVDSEASAEDLGPIPTFEQPANGDSSSSARESRNVASRVIEHDQETEDNALFAKLRTSHDATAQVPARISHKDATLPTKLVDLPNGQ